MSEADDDPDVILGRNVARFRMAREMSQTELGRLIGVHQQTIQKIEKGIRPLKFSEAVEIARVLKISVASFDQSPTSAIAEARVVHKTNEVADKRDLLRAFTRGLAEALVLAAEEIATDRTRQPEDKAPPWRMRILQDLVATAEQWPERFNTEYVTAVQRFATDYYDNISSFAKYDDPQDILNAITKLRIGRNRGLDDPDAPDA